MLDNLNRLARALGVSLAELFAPLTGSLTSTHRARRRS
jgi:hypothetical protein